MLKTCPKCHETKDVELFARSKRTRDGRDGHCKACRKAYFANYYKRNAAQIQEGVASWQARNPRRVREIKQAWASRNPQSVNEAAARRRARLRHAPKVEYIDRRYVYDRDGGKCHICGRHVAFEVFTIDHLVPILFNGEHTSANVRVAHKRCNSARGAGRLPAQLLLVA